MWISNCLAEGQTRWAFFGFELGISRLKSERSTNRATPQRMYLIPESTLSYLPSYDDTLFLEVDIKEAVDEGVHYLV